MGVNQLGAVNGLSIGVDAKDHLTKIASFAESEHVIPMHN